MKRNMKYIYNIEYTIFTWFDLRIRCIRNWHRWRGRRGNRKSRSRGDYGVKSRNQVRSWGSGSWPCRGINYTRRCDRCIQIRNYIDRWDSRKGWKIRIQFFIPTKSGNIGSHDWRSTFWSNTDFISWKIDGVYIEFRRNVDHTAGSNSRRETWKKNE